MKLIFFLLFIICIPQPKASYSARAMFINSLEILLDSIKSNGWHSIGPYNINRYEKLLVDLKSDSIKISISKEIENHSATDSILRRSGRVDTKNRTIQIDQWVIKNAYPRQWKTFAFHEISWFLGTLDHNYKLSLEAYFKSKYPPENHYSKLLIEMGYFGEYDLQNFPNVEVINNKIFNRIDDLNIFNVQFRDGGHVVGGGGDILSITNRTDMLDISILYKQAQWSQIFEILYNCRFKTIHGMNRELISIKEDSKNNHHIVINEHLIKHYVYYNQLYQESLLPLVEKYIKIVPVKFFHYSFSDLSSAREQARIDVIWLTLNEWMLKNINIEACILKGTPR